MKIRQGFVSNSSSTSFLIILDGAYEESAECKLIWHVLEKLLRLKQIKAEEYEYYFRDNKKFKEQLSKIPYNKKSVKSAKLFNLRLPMDENRVVDLEYLKKMPYVIGTIDQAY